MRITTTRTGTGRGGPRTALLCTAVVLAAALTGCGTDEGPDTSGSSLVAAAADCPQWADDPAQDEPAAPPTTVDGTPANTPEAEALAQAVGDLGRGAFADVYAEMRVDSPPGRVLLCVTDLAKGRKLLAAAKEADPSVDPGRADLYLARYGRRQLDAALEKVMGAGEVAGFRVYTGTPEHDASGVVVTTSKEGAASTAFAAEARRLAGEVPVRVLAGEPVRELVRPGTSPAPRG
ncbi:hypothetical protein [Streptomyces sp. NPDC093225]|uniref:hypothetical protein n=1 Tax=Streptomyces sp. NPDC093225 TaxID=3366034 RepID=UPI003812370F